MKFPKKTRDAGIVKKDTPAGRVVAKFGGLANMSESTGIPPSTIWGWIRRGDIPPKRVPEVKRHARDLKIRIKDSEYLRDIEEGIEDEPEETVQ